MIVLLLLTFLAQNVLIVENAGDENGKQLTPIPDKVKKQFENVPTVEDCDITNETYYYLRAMIPRFVPKEFQYLGCIDMLFRTTNLMCEDKWLKYDKPAPQCEKLWKQYNCSLNKLAIPSMDNCNAITDGHHSITRSTVPQMKTTIESDMYDKGVDVVTVCEQIHYLIALPESTRTAHHYAYIYDEGIQYVVSTFAIPLVLGGGGSCLVDLNKKALTFFGLTKSE